MTKIELINLTLDEIRRSAIMVDSVYADAVLANKIEPNEIFEQLSNDCDKILNELRLKLREALEDVANFQNGKGMFSPVDCALTEVPYDLIYERKDEDSY
jgi:hypothetical protein